MLRIFLGTSSYRRMFNLITIVFLLLGILGTGAPTAFASSSLFQQGVVAFLYPPYPGSVAENSIFDHSSPTYNADGNDYVVAWNGVQNTTLSYDGHPGIDYGTNFLPILAAALRIKERTVRFHVENILFKLGAKSRTEAAHVAFREGWLAEDEI